jgi:glycosyltransferase involved in cell wall biosynthesis
MRVVIDATPLLVRSAGVKNYLYHWIRHLERAARPGEIATFPGHAAGGALDHGASTLDRVRTTAALGALALANYTPLPALNFATRAADIFHASSLTHRPPRRPKLTLTIHDLTSLLMPELHPAANIRADHALVELVRHASGVIAVSECTRQDAIRVLGLDPGRITAIHSGIADAFFEQTAERIGAVREQYRLPRPFVLFIGTIEPRKNLDTLFGAWAALKPALRAGYELVVAGPLGWAAEATRRRLGEVRYLGYVPEADIAALTAAASVFAYPSLYEGFGFPVAQAMAAGVPVLTSNVSSLPEIAGGAALLVDPRSQSEITTGLTRLLEDPALRGQLAEAGRQRAAAFRWERTAALSLEFFARIAAE